MRSHAVDPPPPSASVVVGNRDVIGLVAPRFCATFEKYAQGFGGQLDTRYQTAPMKGIEQ